MSKVGLMNDMGSPGNEMLWCFRASIRDSWQTERMDGRGWEIARAVGCGQCSFRTECIPVSQSVDLVGLPPDTLAKFRRQFCE